MWLLGRFILINAITHLPLHHAVFREIPLEYQTSHQKSTPICPDFRTVFIAHQSIKTRFLSLKKPKAYFIYTEEWDAQIRHGTNFFMPLTFYVSGIYGFLNCPQKVFEPSFV